jgi:hypothetical protein
MAKDTAGQDSYFPEFRPDEDMTAVREGNNFLNKGIQYGGWVTPVFINQYQGAGTSYSSSINSLRLWMRSYLWNNSYLYVRGKYTFSAVDNGNTTDHLVDVDAAFINAQFLDKKIEVTLGRKYFLLGSGLVLNGRGDGAEVDVYTRYIRAKILTSYTGLLLKDNNPYNISSQDVADGAKRLFVGGSLSYILYNQKIYAISLAQMDFADEAAGTRTRYQSQYWGGGLEGALPWNLSYNSEFIYETGTSYTALSQEKKIRAMAALFNLNWQIKETTSPVVMVQYAYGSGDSDRDNYTGPTAGALGNDTGFVTFGTFLAGYGLRPTPGNLHVLRGGFSLSPTEMLDNLRLKRTTLIAKYSLYMKDKKDGVISGGETTEEELLVGHGIDLSLRWKIFSDISFFANYGLFIPGNAYYSSQQPNHFTMAGMNISF